VPARRARSAGAGTNAAHGAGEWLVVEADESDRSFLELAPEIALVTARVRVSPGSGSGNDPDVRGSGEEQDPPMLTPKVSQLSAGTAHPIKPQRR
jgi:hypothetical protein